MMFVCDWKTMYLYVKLPTQAAFHMGPGWDKLCPNLGMLLGK